MYRVIVCAVVAAVFVPTFVFGSEHETETESCTQTTFRSQSGEELEVRENESDTEARTRLTSGHPGLADNWSIDTVQMNADGCAEKTIRAGEENRPGRVTFCKEDGETCFTCPKDNSICRSSLSRVREMLDKANENGGSSEARAAMDRLVDSLRGDQNLFNTKQRAEDQISSMSEALQNAFGGGSQIGGVSTKPLADYGAQLGEIASGVSKLSDKRRSAFENKDSKKLFQLVDKEDVPGMLGNIADDIYKKIERCGDYNIGDCGPGRRIAQAMERSASSLDEFDEQFGSSPREQQTGFNGGSGSRDGAESDRGRTGVRVPDDVIEEVERRFPDAYRHANERLDNSSLPQSVRESLKRGIWGISSGIESGLRRCVSSETGALGPFQFTRSTWRDMMPGVSLSERCNPVRAAEATIRLAEHNWDTIGSAVRRSGVDPTVGVFLAHNLGANNAKNVLEAYRRDPSTSARSVISGGAWGPNKGLYPGSVGEAVETIAAKISDDQRAFAGRGAGGFGGAATELFSNLFGGDGRTPGQGNMLGGLISGIQRLFGGGSSGSNNSLGGSSRGSGSSGGDSRQMGDTDISVSQDVDQDPALTLIISPREAAVGDTVRFIWATAGVRAESCVIRDEGNNVVVRGSDGSEEMTVASTTEPGTHSFRLTCSLPDESSSETETAELRVVE